MRDIAREHLWKIHIAFIVLFGAFAMPVWITSACADTQGARDGDHRAVWKLIDAERTRQASATAVGSRLVLTVAHYLFNILDAGSDKLVLVQEDGNGQIEIVRARAVSATHDLALLETEAPMEHNLRIANGLPDGLADQFRAAGYAEGNFEILLVITQSLHGDVDYYDFPMLRVIRGGVSGGPVLAPNGEAVGMLRTSNGNIAGAVRFEVISDFLAGDVGVACGTRGLQGCLDEAVRRTKQLAESGDLAAQFQLGRGDRYILGAPELRWLKSAAQGGHARARRDLGNALFDGASGLAKDWPRSNYWLRLAGEEEDAVAQNNLSNAYLYGEGVPKDPSESLEWLLRSLRNG